MPRCLICSTTFSLASSAGPAESCDCGWQVSRQTYAELSEAESHDVAAAIEAWPVHCERCHERHGRIVKGQPCHDYGDAELMCADCLSDAAEAAHERFLSDFYGGSGPVTITEQCAAAWRQKRELER